MKETGDELRQKAILASAFQAFSNYGFRKTSMDDIAKGAGMSRPAVYLYYKNKEAIIRELTKLYFAEKATAVAAALASSGSVSQVLDAAIQAQMDGMATILASPHGVEMLDTTKSMSTDIVELGDAELTDLFAQWLSDMQAKGRARLFDTPDETAKTIAASLRGIKLTSSSAEEFEKRIKQLASMIGAGLEVR